MNTVDNQSKLSAHHARASELYQAGDYKNAILELKQALQYVASQEDADIIRNNISTIAEALQATRSKAQTAPIAEPLPEQPQVETMSEEEFAEPTTPPHQSRLLIVTIVVGLLCLTPILFKLGEIVTGGDTPTPVESTATPIEGESAAIVPENTQPVVAQPPATYYISGSAVNMREKPTVQSNTLVRLKQGDEVKVLEDKTITADGYTWSKISSSRGVEGWVASQFVSEKAVANAPAVPATTENTAMTETTPSVEAATTPATETAATEPTSTDTAATSTQPAASGAGLKVSADHVSLRKGPTTNEAVIITLSKGANVTVMEGAPVEADGYTWVQIKTENGLTGWMVQKFIGN